MAGRTFIIAALAFAACTGPDPGDTSIDPDPAVDVYAFDGREGGSSVSYSGQTMRHLLIDDLTRYVADLTGRVDAGYNPQPGDVSLDASFYLDFDGETSGGIAHGMSTDPSSLQQSYGEISDKNLLDKLAGNDVVGQHKDWSTGLVGWGEPGSTSPQALIDTWIAQVDQAAVDRANGRIPTDPTGALISSVAVSADGLDRQQLIEKFLRGAIAYSQGTDDYLDDDLPGKGLLADHSLVLAGRNYTELEHAWDEAFGYFGASRFTGELTPAAIAESAWLDSDLDGAIDLQSEVTWGHALNAAKRDVGAVQPTTFTAEAWAAFTGGRVVIASASGPLSDSELELLTGHRDRAIAAWERTIAANCVHYINETLRDQSAIGTQEYSFSDHAKHWSELKGFALSLQFNPRSELAGVDFTELHRLIGDQPALGDLSQSQRDDYADSLLQTRALLGRVYRFDDQNLGDDDGKNGW